MEDNNIRIQKDLNDMNEAPPLQSNNMYYNCSECPSIIEIISINENNIEYKCNNNHNNNIEIKEYLKNMK